MLKKVSQWLFYDKQGHLVIAQFPNAPLTLWFMCVIASIFVTSPTWSHILSVVGTTSLAIWAILELVNGVNGFRKLLGFSMLVYILWIFVYLG